MNTAQLERECRSYARYLIGQAPSAYVIGKYRDFHLESDASARTLDPFDHFLVRVSARAPFWARLADTYATRFRKNSTVHRKLVLMLALLECAPTSFVIVEQMRGGGLVGAAALVGWEAARYALVLVMSIAIFTPVRLAMALSSRSGAAEAAEH
jgi:hypothetical protein